MPEMLHPDVYTTEQGLPPAIVGASTSTAMFVGTSRRGPVGELGFVSGFREFQRLYGKNYPDSYLEDSLYLFFENGGRRAYIGRATGAGAAKSTIDLPALAGAPAAPAITSGNSELFNLEPADVVTVSVDGGGGQTITFLATRATRPGAGLAIVDLTGLTLLITIDGGDAQIVTFTGAEASAADVAAAINAQLKGGFAVVNAGEVDISSDTRGLGSIVNITGGTALAEIGHSIGVTNGTGNVQDIDAVTAAEVVALFVALPLVGATASDLAGAVKITHDTPGLASTLEITAAAAAFGFPAGVVAGTDASPVPLLQIDAINEGAWGDGITITTEQWRYLTTAILSNGDSSIALNSVARVQLGDVVTISDGTTTTNVHVRTIDVANKTIGFVPVVLGAPIAAGALANTASTHRSKTTLAAAALATDTIVTLAALGQIRVGTELSFDDGTNLVFRRVTSINGTKVTLAAALGFAMAAGTLVVSQHFSISVSVDNEFDKTHSFLSIQDEDTQDWAEVRLLGQTNQSLQIEVTDLNPAIVSDIENRVAPVVNLALAGGVDGAAPTDNEYIAAIELVDTLLAGEVNTLAAPGISTLLVQQALTDVAERKQNLVALIEPPLSTEDPIEAKDWRLNQHNRDSSYSVFYFPWVEIRDRYSSVDGATKSAPPSGAMAGQYALIDSETGPWTAPGNRLLRQVIRPVVKIADGQHDLLNPIGVNVIREYPGEGTRAWGVRTMSNKADGRHYINVRRLLNFVKLSASKALRPWIFASNDSRTYGDMAKLIEAFYRTIWKAGGLYPPEDFSSAQYVKIDGENNPTETRRLGQLFIDSGLNPPLPAEFINFRLGLFDGEQVTDEIVS